VRSVLAGLRGWAGIGNEQVTHAEKWISTVGGLAGILCVVLISQSQLGLAGSASIIASMGSSPVLLFAVPPVMLNAATILVVAMLFNAPFAWRRYPAAWSPALNANISEAKATGDALVENVRE